MDTPLIVPSIPIADLILDDVLQPRCEIDLSMIEDYAMLLMEGVELPPLAVFRATDERLFLADGFHRLRAHQVLNRTVVPCFVHIGDRRDAIVYSVSANAKHGKPRSRGDLTRSFETLKREGLIEPGDAARVRELLQCSGAWAFRLTQADRDQARRERDRVILEKRGEGKSEREIARETGVPRPTVYRVLDQAVQNSTVESWKTPPSGDPAPLSNDFAVEGEAIAKQSPLQRQAVPVSTLGDEIQQDPAANQPPVTDLPEVTPAAPRFEDYVNPTALEAWYRVVKALQALAALQPVPQLIQSPCPQVFYAVEEVLPAARNWLHRFEEEFAHVKQLP